MEPARGGAGATKQQNDGASTRKQESQSTRSKHKKKRQWSRPGGGQAGREEKGKENEQDKTKNKLREVHREVGNGKNTRGQDKTEGWEIGSSGTKKEKSEEKEGRGGAGRRSAAKKDGSRAGGSKTVAKNGWKFAFGLQGEGLGRGLVSITIKTPEAFGLGGFVLGTSSWQLPG